VREAQREEEKDEGQGMTRWKPKKKLVLSRGEKRLIYLEMGLRRWGGANKAISYRRCMVFQVGERG